LANRLQKLGDAKPLLFCYTTILVLW